MSLPLLGADTAEPRRALRPGQTVPIVGAGFAFDPRRAMTQTSNRFLDEMARLMNDAAGVASGVRREFDTVVRNQADRILRDLDVVKREEFEAVKEMARLAREENEDLKARVAALEARLGPGRTP
jgi:BMFP domain-containing protein YqiC